jgi:sugar-specific transcriptional regulator TrmB
MPSSDELELRVRKLLGLSGYEARVYLALLGLGKARPAEIAKASRVPSQRVYDVLRSLVSMNLVGEENGYYYAIDPYRALSAKAEEVMVKASEEAHQLRELGKELSRLARRSGKEYVQIVYGVEESVARALEALRRCTEPPIFMVYKALDRLETLWPLLVLLIKRLPKGTIVILPRTVKVPEDKLRLVEAQGAKIVTSKTVMMDLMLACDTVIIGLPSTPYNVVSLVISNPIFAEALRRRLEEIMRNQE